MNKVFLKAYSQTIYAWLFTSAVTIGFHWQVHQSSIVTATNCVRLSWDSLVNVTNVVNPNLGKKQTLMVLRSWLIFLELEYLLIRKNEITFRYIIQPQSIQIQK